MTDTPTDLAAELAAIRRAADPEGRQLADHATSHAQPVAGCVWCPPAPARPWTDADHENTRYAIADSMGWCFEGDEFAHAATAALDALAAAGRLADPQQQERLTKAERELAQIRSDWWKVSAERDRNMDRAHAEIERLRARVAELERQRETARRDGAADGILLAREHVSYDDREVLTLLAQHVRDGLTIPTTDTTEEQP